MLLFFLSPSPPPGSSRRRAWARALGQHGASAARAARRGSGRRGGTAGGGSGRRDGWSGAARLGRGRRSERRRERAPGGRRALAGLQLAGASAGKQRMCRARVEQHAEAGDAQRGRAGGAERIQAAGWRWRVWVRKLTALAVVRRGAAARRRLAGASRELAAQASARRRSCGGGLLREMQERDGINPDYAMVISRWCKSGRIEHAAKVFDEMLAAGEVKPTAVMYNASFGGRRGEGNGRRNPGAGRPRSSRRRRSD
jgi:pentatricopeptide repeat protein